MTSPRLARRRPEPVLHAALSDERAHDGREGRLEPLAPAGRFRHGARMERGEERVRALDDGLGARLGGRVVGRLDSAAYGGSCRGPTFQPATAVWRS